MRLLTLIFLLVAAGHTAAQAVTLPDSVSYSIYMNGERRGASKIAITQSEDTIVFTSRNTMEFNTASMDLRSRTEADAKTFQIRRFEYEGDKANMTLRGTVVVRDDSIFADSVTPGRAGKFAIRVQRSHTLFLEDYVMEHEILIALAQQAAGKGPTEYALLFPSGFSSVIATQEVLTKVSISSDIAEAVTDKIQVHLSGSDPYFLLFDSKRSLPVYMVFPATRVEVFLDAFFGPHPLTRYVAEGDHDHDH